MKVLRFNPESIQFLKNLEEFIYHEYGKNRNSPNLEANPLILDLQRWHISWTLIEINEEYLNNLTRILLIQDNQNPVSTEIHDINIKMISILDNILFGYPYTEEEIKRDTDRTYLFERTFYNIYYEESNNKIKILIKDFIALPKDFVCSYFGYDTGISGLNQLMMGGFLLPEDSSAIITVDGESGVGKTTFVVNLVCSLIQNYEDPMYKLQLSGISTETRVRYSVVVDYLILEQSYKNILRCISNFNLMTILSDKNSSKSDEEFYFSKETKGYIEIYHSIPDKTDKKDKLKNKEKLIMTIRPVPMCSAADLLDKVQKIEDSFLEKSKKHDSDRHIIVIDSINAVLDMDIEQSKWRQVLQALRAILDKKQNTNTENFVSNSILILTQEKNPSRKDTMVEYFCDVVLGFEKRNVNGEYLRYIELIESRFQEMCYGRHPFHFSTKGQASFGIYPSASALMEIIPNQLTQIQPNRIKEEYGIKIDGILKFFEYTHLKKSDMKPYFLKNSVSLLNGEKGCHKSSFAKFFTLSSYRDEKWVYLREDQFNNKFINNLTKDEVKIHEINYSDTEPDQIWLELAQMKPFYHKKIERKSQLSHCYPIDKSIGMIVKFGENYEENDYDAVIDAPWGKVIIPANAIEEKPTSWGHVSDVICHYEVRNFSEEYYLEQIMDVIRAIETFKIYESIPTTFEELLKRVKLSKILWEKNKSISEVNGPQNGYVEFSPSHGIYKGKDFISENIIDKDDLNKYDDSFFKYHNSLPIKIRRLVLDNTENLIDIFKQIEAQDFITTITHFGLAKGITILIVNQSSKGFHNQINDICNAITENIFEFQREFFGGEWYSVFHIKRSSTGWHNRMYYNLIKRHDGLLALMDTFAFVSSFQSQGKDLIPVRLFLPGKSQNEVDMYANLADKMQKSYHKLELHKLFANHFWDKKSSLPYKDLHEQWHMYLKEMIIYSITHPEVEVINASDPFTDISIIIEDESVKDALTISCIPGHLVKRYKTNLLRLTDFINFSPKLKSDSQNIQKIPNFVSLTDQWMITDPSSIEKLKPEFTKTIGKGKLGKTHYFLQKSSLKFDANTVTREACPFSWIEPDLLFNPVLDISHNKENVEYKTAHALAYPFFINPRLDLVITKKGIEPGISNTHFGSATTEDYFTYFLELLFEHRSILKALTEFSKVASTSRIGYQIEDIEQLIKSDPAGTKAFISRNWFSSHHQFLDILTQNLRPDILTQLCFTYRVPKIMSYSTWYLGVPLNSPRKDRACEIIVKMTEYHDLANFQLNGIGIQLSNYAYSQDSYKYFPHLSYKDLKNRISNFKQVSDKNQINEYGIPLASMDCFYELITPIGGILQNFHQMLKSSYATCDSFKNKNMVKRIASQITEIFYSYTIDNECDKCYFNFLTNEREKLSPSPCECWLGTLFGLKKGQCSPDNNC